MIYLINYFIINKKIQDTLKFNKRKYTDLFLNIE